MLYVKPLKPRESLLTIEQEDEESEEDNKCDIEQVVEELIISDEEVTE